MFTTDEKHSTDQKDVGEEQNTADVTTVDDDGECEICEENPNYFLQ